MTLVNNGINSPERHNIELVAVRCNHKPLYLYQCFFRLQHVHRLVFVDIFCYYMYIHQQMCKMVFDIMGNESIPRTSSL